VKDLLVDREEVVSGIAGQTGKQYVLIGTIALLGCVLSIAPQQ
jgi:hypothetical protein